MRWITDLTYKIECRAAEAGTIYQLASQYYKDIIKKEVVLASITGNDHILCIGGGICPFSAIIFHQTTGAKVTVIDNNMACIPKAKEIIDRLSIGNFVHVLYQDGGSKDVDLTAYSVVHLALQVTPMDYVFSQVERQVLPGAKLLIRRPKQALGGMYSKMSNPQLAGCPYVAHKSRNIGSTLLYIKQDQKAS